MNECRVVLDWGGRQWDVTGVLVSVVTDASLTDDSVTVPTRVVEVDLPLGDVVAHARTHHPRLAMATIYIGDRVVVRDPVDSIVPGRAGEASRVRVGEIVQPDASQVPASYDLRTRRINVEATQRAYKQYERWQDRGVANYDAMNRPLPWIYTINPGSWLTVYSDNVEGAVYQRIYGQPGVSGVAGSTALPIDASNQILMVAGHHCTPGTATIIGPRQSNLDLYAAEACTVYNGLDDAGRPVALVDVSGLSTVAHNWTTANGAQDKEWWLRWDGTAAGLEGGAVDVIVDLMLHMQNTSIDWASVESARGWLDGFVLDGTIDATVSAESVLMQQVLPLLPVRLVRGVDGLGLVPVLWRATAADARCALVAGQDCAPVTRVQHASANGSEVTNQILLSWAMNRRSKGASKVLSVGPARHDWAAESATLHGLRSTTYETPWVYRASTAGRVATSMIDRMAVDRLTVDVAVRSEVYGFGGVRELAVGDVVTYTDATEALDGAVALVSSVTRDGSSADVVRLVLL